MREWFILHPYMTFFLAALALLIVNSVITNICKAVSSDKDKPLTPPVEEDT